MTALLWWLGLALWCGVFAVLTDWLDRWIEPGVER